MAATAALLAAASPIDDPSDVYWHVVVGDEIRATGQVPGAGDAWAWFDPPDPWTSSQWLSEVAMSWLVERWGWTSLVGTTLLLSAVVVVGLLIVLHRHATPRAATIIFALVVLPLGFAFQTRPGLVTLVGAVAVGSMAWRTLTEGTVPSWWLVPGVALWSNLHGGWVIAPAVIGTAVVLRWLESPGVRLRFLGRASLVVAATLVAGCLNPVGWRSLVLPLQFRGVTSHLNEWQPTVLLEGFALPLLVVVVVIVVSWARSSERVPPVHIVYVLVWVVFGLTAFRNVAVAALVLAPMAASWASRAFEGSRRVPSRTERRALLVATSALSALGVVWLTVEVATVDPLSEATPLTIAQEIASDRGPVRVLNHYNTAGVLLAFGPEEIELGIDGRAERYGEEYIDAYLDVFALQGDEWPDFIDDFDPDLAVVALEDAVRHYLEDDLGWQPVVEDDPYILLAP